MGIGKRLKEARERAGLTQEELGKMVGVTGSSITNYEKETSHPKEPVMYALFDALGVEPNFLFQDCVHLPKKENSPSTTEAAPGDKQEVEFMRLVHDLEPEHKDFLVAVMKVLLGQDK